MPLLLQAALMLGTAVVLGRLARLAKLPAVIGELFGGIILGPTWLDLFRTPSSGREILARIGLIAFLFVAGLEVDLQYVRRHGAAVVATSIGGIVLPFISALIVVRVAPSIWQHSIPAGELSLFLGAALAISALPVIARIILDLRFERLPLASVVLASATIDDVLGWTLFAVIVGRKAPLTTMTVLPFLAGALLSPRLGRNEKLRNVVIWLLAPFFFVSLGLRVNFIANFDWLLVVVVIVIASVGKISGVMLGARIGGFAAREAFAIGMAMNARGAVEMVLASVALQVSLIDGRLFVALVTMAVVTSAIAGPSMELALGPRATACASPASQNTAPQSRPT
jgi:Kef-type K+ transport system membrane component KefB